MEGEVKLWDLRGRSDQAVTTWNLMQDVGLSAFDVHATAEVVAGSELFASWCSKGLALTILVDPRL